MILTLIQCFYYCCGRICFKELFVSQSFACSYLCFVHVLVTFSTYSSVRHWQWRQAGSVGQLANITLQLLLMCISLSFVVKPQEIPCLLKCGNSSVKYKISSQVNSLHFSWISKKLKKDWLDVLGTEQRENLRQYLEQNETGKYWNLFNKDSIVGPQGVEVQKIDHSIRSHNQGLAHREVAP